MSIPLGRSTPTRRLVASTLPSPMERDGKQLRSVPTAAIIGIAAIILPVWTTTILPLTILYKIGATILSPILSNKEKQQKSLPPINSGYFVDHTKIVPRAERKYDIVILGATGFTGQLAVRYLAKTYGIGSSDKGNKDGVGGVQWAVAGRNEAKIRNVLNDLAIELNMPGLLNGIDVIVVDTSLPSTMPKLVEQTRCVATTTGPYSLLGNSVVEFCSKYGTHYVDITGEVDWIRIMVDAWQETAQRTGAILVPFCGHDSIPWDLSVMKLQELLKEECNDDIKSVTFWDATIGKAPGGTYQTVFSIIEGTARKASKYAIDPYLRLPQDPRSKSSSICTHNNPITPEKSSFPWKLRSTSTGMSCWTVPFVMADVNYNVVRWSYALRQQGSSLVYREAMVAPNMATAYTMYSGLIIMGSMLMNPFTTYILKKYVLPKPGEGPLLNDMENKHFLCVYGEGIGTNGNVVESIFYLPKDAGCLETSRMLIESGLCLALSEHKVGAIVRDNGGGFYPPSIAFGDNNLLLNRLTNTGTEFASRVVPLNEII